MHADPCPDLDYRFRGNDAGRLYGLCNRPSSPRSSNQFQGQLRWAGKGIKSFRLGEIRQVPAHEELIDQTLQAIRALGGSASIAEIDEKVVENLQLPEEIAGQPHGTGRQTEIKYRLRWARTYLKNHGLITNSDRGVWALTPEGVKAEAVEPREVVRSVRQQLNRSQSGMCIC